jgi:spermidine synthase
MATLWEKSIDENHYQVKNAGNTRRIYKNGVLHSQFNPTKLFTGSVWDLLSLPALFYPPESIKRVLLLGVGGGTVIHQLPFLSNVSRIVGIDLDKTQLMLARKFFALKKSDRVKLHHAEAKSWLQNNKQQRFDMIIDDIFTEHDGEPVRAIASDTAWMRLLLSRLNGKGVLVQNYTDRNELKKSAALTDTQLFDAFQSRYRFTTEHYENNVAVFSRAQIDASELRQRLSNLQSDKITINRSTVSLKIRNINV